MVKVMERSWLKETTLTIGFTQETNSVKVLVVLYSQPVHPTRCASNNKISLLVEIKVLASAELTSVFHFTFCFALICLDALHMRSVYCAV